MEFLEFKELYIDLEKRYLEIYKYLDLDFINKTLKTLKIQTIKYIPKRQQNPYNHPRLQQNLHNQKQKLDDQKKK